MKSSKEWIEQAMKLESELAALKEKYGRALAEDKDTTRLENELQNLQNKAHVTRMAADASLVMEKEEAEKHRREEADRAAKQVEALRTKAAAQADEVINAMEVLADRLAEVRKTTTDADVLREKYGIKVPPVKSEEIENIAGWYRYILPYIQNTYEMRKFMKGGADPVAMRIIKILEKIQ